MQKQASRTLSEPTPGPVRLATPDVDIFETADGWKLQAEMPGVSKAGLSVTLEGNELTIAGRRPSVPGDLIPIFQELETADFRRVFELDLAIDADKIAAQMDQGVLTLHLPKAERVKPRRIEVAG